MKSSEISLAYLIFVSVVCLIGLMLGSLLRDGVIIGLVTLIGTLLFIVAIIFSRGETIIGQEKA